MGAVHLEAAHLEVVHLVVAHLVVRRPAVSLPAVSLPAVCHWAAHPAAGPEIRMACWKKAVRRRAERRTAVSPNSIQTAAARR